MRTVISTQVLHQQDQKFRVTIPYVREGVRMPALDETVQVVSQSNGAKFPGRVIAILPPTRSYQIEIDLSEEIVE